MSKRIIPASEFAKWLEREWRKQEAKSAPTLIVPKYRAYAVGNAWGMWTRATAGLVDSDGALTVEAYQKFRVLILRGANSNVQKGTTEGYSIVLRMLDRVGVTF